MPAEGVENGGFDGDEVFLVEWGIWGAVDDAVEDGRGHLLCLGLSVRIEVF